MYLEQALGSETRIKVLRTLYQEAFPQMDAASLAQETGKSRASVHRALAELSGFGILVKVTRGRSALYAVNVEHAWFGPFYELFLEERRRHNVPHLFPTFWNHLETVVSRIAQARGVLAIILYGSLTRAPVYPNADVDLLVVTAAKQRVPEQDASVLGHPVSILSMDADVLERKSAGDDAFLASSLERHVLLYKAPDYELPWVPAAPKRGARR